MAPINFSGIASGIDSNALIDAISTATKQARVVPNETKVTELGETNAVFTDLKTKLLALQELAYNFSTLGGGALSKNALSSDETAVTASASNAATNGSYTLTVTNKARNHTHSFNNAFTSSSTAIDATISDATPADDAINTITYNIGNGADAKSIAVRVTSTMTPASFVEKFNANATASAPGYATASLVNVGTTAVPSYRIVVNTNNQGTAKGEISTVATGAYLTGGVLDAADPLKVTEVPAENAEFSISGIAGTITRSSNAISDVITGVTFNIQAEAGTSTITITDDVAKSQSTVQEFVDAYNEIVKFIAENNAISREEDGEDVSNTFAPLSKSRTDDNFLISFRNAMSLSRNQSITNSTSIAVNTLSDIGFQTQRDGTIKFVTTDAIQSNFQDAMATDSSLVNSVLTRLGDLVGTVAGVTSLIPGGGVIQQYTRGNGLIDVSVNGNKTLITTLNDKIGQANAFIKAQEDSLRARFARLESLTGKLQGQQQALTSALSGLG